MNNKVIMNDLENIPYCVEDFYGQLNQFNTCFAFLVHLTSTFHCNPSILLLDSTFFCQSGGCLGYL